MTNVIIIGEKPTNKKEIKKIEFVKAWDSVDKSSAPIDKPADFKYIELIAKGYMDGFDLLFAYDNPKERGQGICLIGHFNDGVV